jgi:hypothetical protein
MAMSRFRRIAASGAGVAASVLLLSVMLSPLLASPASASPAAGTNLLLNGNFETNFVQGATPPPDWSLINLGAETDPYGASIETWNAQGEYPPPAASPDPEGVADEVYYDAGSATGIEGIGGEQTSSTFGSITQADDPQVSYSALENSAPEATNSAWAGSALEINFSATPVNYTLIYFDPWQAYDSTFSGSPTNSATVKYIVGPTLNTKSWYTQSPRDLNSDIENAFGLSTYTVTSVVFADLEDTTSAASPYPNMDGYFADIGLYEGGGTVTTPPGSQLSTLTFTPPATDGGLYDPEGVAANNGTVYVSNTKDNVVAAVGGGTTSIVAGSYEGYGETGDGGLAVNATLYQPVGLAYDPTTDELFIADSGDNVVREVNISTGVIGLFAGDGTAGNTGNGGHATSAELDQPQGLAVDAHGDVFITDADSNEVREVTTDGIIHDFAGDGTAGYTGDGGPATSADLDQPSGVAVDTDGNVYIADSSNNAIRRVDASTGVITTVAGNTTAGYAGDGGSATVAELDDPQDIAVDPDGDVFVADTFNNAVREITPADQISTVVNSGLLNSPYALAVDDSTGNVYVANTSDSYILESAGLGSTSSPGPGPVGQNLAPVLPESPVIVALPFAGLALLLGGGWFVTRRQRSARRTAGLAA